MPERLRFRALVQTGLLSDIPPSSRDLPTNTHNVYLAQNAPRLLDYALPICRRQPLVLFGILGLPTSWLDVITMDLDLFNILREEGPLGMFRVLWKIGRPCLPGHRPNWMNEMFPITAAALTSAIKAQVSRVEVSPSYSSGHHNS